VYIGLGVWIGLGLGVWVRELGELTFKSNHTHPDLDKSLF
jgi:hypothetical protein